MKDGPAFQLYAADFYMDTVEWSSTQVGIYFRLLMYEWVNGVLPNDEKRLARIAGTDPGNFKKTWAQDIAKKFSPNSDGNLINRRMEEVRLEQQEYRKSQREAGLRGVEVKKKKGIFPFDKSSNPSTDPSSNPASENQALLPSSSSSINNIRILLSQFLFDEILKRRPNLKKPNLKTWAKDIDLMIRVDKRDPKEIEKVIEWCQADEFWQDNILSTAKLRKQFDQLALKAGKQPYIAKAPESKEVEQDTRTGEQQKADMGKLRNFMGGVKLKTMD